MNTETMYKLAIDIFGDLPSQENCEIIIHENFSELNLSEGKHELGLGKWINENVHINTNERVDSKTILLNDNPDFDGISFNHHHRQGWRGSLIFYKKSNNELIS